MLCNYTHEKFMQILVKPQGKSFDEKNENRDQSWLTVNTIPSDILSNSYRKTISRPGL